jgi:hypothetical protein
MAAATKKKRKEEAYPWKASASSGHTTNLKQSILETFNIYGFNPFGLHPSLNTSTYTRDQKTCHSCSLSKWPKVWRPDTQYNDTQHNDTQHNDTQHNDTQHNDTQHNDTQHKVIFYDIQHK